MENITIKDEAVERALQTAFENAKKRRNELRSMYNDQSTGEGSFDSKEHDVFMNFDYNKDPDAIPAEMESKIRFIMQIVQHQATNALAAAHEDLTRDSETWIDFFMNYPLLFNFQSRNSKKYHEDNFTLSGSIAEATQFVKAFLGYSCPAGIALNLIGAIQSATGPVLNKQTTEKNMQYLALCRGYDKASTLTIYRAQLDMKIDQVKAVCVNTKNIAMNITYDEVTFEINNDLALGIYPALSKEAIEVAEKYMGTFFKKYAAKEYEKFEEYLKQL